MTDDNRPHLEALDGGRKDEGPEEFEPLEDSIDLDDFPEFPPGDLPDPGSWPNVESVVVRFHGDKLATARIEAETCTLYRAAGGDYYVHRATEHDGMAWLNYSWKGERLTEAHLWAFWPELAEAAGLER